MVKTQTVHGISYTCQNIMYIMQFFFRQSKSYLLLLLLYKSFKSEVMIHVGFFKIFLILVFIVELFS